KMVKAARESTRLNGFGDVGMLAEIRSLVKVRRRVQRREFSLEPTCDLAAGRLDSVGEQGLDMGRASFIRHGLMPSQRIFRRWRMVVGEEGQECPTIIALAECLCQAVFQPIGGWWPSCSFGGCDGLVESSAQIPCCVFNGGEQPCNVVLFCRAAYEPVADDDIVFGMLAGS